MKRFLIATMLVPGLVGRANATACSTDVHIAAIPGRIEYYDRYIWLVVYRDLLGSNDLGSCNVYSATLNYCTGLNSWMDVFLPMDWDNENVTFTPSTCVNNFQFQSTPSTNPCGDPYNEIVNFHITGAYQALIFAWAIDPYGDNSFRLYLGRFGETHTFPPTCASTDCRGTILTNGLRWNSGSATYPYSIHTGMIYLSGMPSGCHPSCELEDPKPTNAWSTVKQLYR